MRTQESNSAKKTRRIRPAESLPILQPHAAGIDLGNAEHYVCAPSDSVAQGQSPVRSFGVFNPQLDEMVEWLKGCGVKTVAMESTGVMWIPVYQKLEAAGFEVVLVNTKGLKHVPGRKISGGRVLSSKTPHVINRVAVLLRVAALTIGRTDSCLGSFYRRISHKHGPPKAMTATARKLAELIYHLMVNREEFVSMDTKKYEERVTQQKIIRLSREAKKLGLTLVPSLTTDPKAANAQ